MKSLMNFVIVLALFTAIPSAADEHSGPTAAIDTFRTALATGNRAAIKDVLADDVLVFEGGGVERSLKEYSSHHLGSDIKFSKSVDFKLAERTVHEENELAVISSRYNVSGSYKGSDIDLTMNETITVSKSNESAWKIIQIHWSN